MATTTYRFITDTINGTSRPSEPTKNGKATTEDKFKESNPVPVTFKVIKQTPIVREDVNKAETVVKDVADKVPEEYPDLVERAEAAIAGKPFPPVQEVSLKNTAAETVSTEEVPISESKIKVYDAPLPLDFEPPPGFSRPPPPKSKFEAKPGQPESKSESAPVVLPLVAPALASASEPIITHLAGAIDNLATYLKSDPKAAEQASDVLELAKSDLTALVERMEVVKEQERTALKAKMDEQTREYTLKLLEMEMEGQDKLEHQEHEFRIFFEQERARFIQAYREKLDQELRVQTELINER